MKIFHIYMLLFASTTSYGSWLLSHVSVLLSFQVNCGEAEQRRADVYLYLIISEMDRLQYLTKQMDKV